MSGNTKAGSYSWLGCLLCILRLCCGIDVSVLPRLLNFPYMNCKDDTEDLA